MLNTNTTTINKERPRPPSDKTTVVTTLSILFGSCVVVCIVVNFRFLKTAHFTYNINPTIIVPARESKQRVGDRHGATESMNFPRWALDEADSFIDASEFCHECPFLGATTNGGATTCRQHIDHLLEEKGLDDENSRRELEDKLKRTEPASCRRTVKRFQNEREWLDSLPSSPSLADSEGTTLPRILAIYFPQFHPDPLNNRLWGENFTDWIS